MSLFQLKVDSQSAGQLLALPGQWHIPCGTSVVKVHPEHELPASTRTSFPWGIALCIPLCGTELRNSQVTADQGQKQQSQTSSRPEQ